MTTEKAVSAKEYNEWEAKTIKWLSSLPTKPRHNDKSGSFCVSVAERAFRLGWFETTWSDWQMNIIFEWLQVRQRAIPYGDGEINFLIQD